KGFMINKFRGDPALFDDGYALIEARTGWRGFGVLPWFGDAAKLPAEDALDLGEARGDGPLHIACLAFSRIANFDDLDPLGLEPGVRVTMVRAGEAIPGDVDLVILPGSKSTRGDLAFLRAQGWDVDLVAHHRRGGRILGICGGYQMLGTSISDPEGLEGAPGEVEGLGLLDVVTEMVPDKTLTRISARHALTGCDFTGYEIHIGRSSGTDCARPFAHVADRMDGAISADGLVQGSYLHGMFSDDAFRAAYLNDFGLERSTLAYDVVVDQALDDLAAHLEAHLDLDGLFSLAD
ncbi:MAG: cobyric acid synthase, partial [Paracoccaceae bacterium]